VAAVLVTNGREAVIAFQQGDEIRGLVYGTSAAIGVIGVLRAERTLASLSIFRGSRFRAIRVGSLATAASGVLLAGYEVSLGFASTDEMSRRFHFERAASQTIDTGLLLVPGYGTAIILSWSLTITGLSLILPNPLAAKITSSPGSAIVFLFEYVFTTGIPSAIAEQALTDALGVMAALLHANAVILGIPSVPIIP
jgi:hypothetical protein